MCVGEQAEYQVTAPAPGALGFSRRAEAGGAHPEGSAAGTQWRCSSGFLLGVGTVRWGPAPLLGLLIAAPFYLGSGSSLGCKEEDEEEEEGYQATRCCSSRATWM